MHDRLDTIGGTLTITSQPNTHTTIHATIPTTGDRSHIDTPDNRAVLAQSIGADRP